MPNRNDRKLELGVTFVGLETDEQAPRIAAYQVDRSGRAVKKLGSLKDKKLNIDLGDTRSVAIGPDTEDFANLPKQSLISYRVAQKADLWRDQGLVLPREIWDRFRVAFVCVSGNVRKCRPWFWDFLDDFRLAPMYELAQVARIKPITAELTSHVLFPIRCAPMCDGIIEIYERTCCCRPIEIFPILERLREILEVLPLPIPDPRPDPVPGPFPGPDPVPFTAQLMRAKARTIQKRKQPLDFVALPPERLHQDYLALRNLPVDSARSYIDERPYLLPIFCSCSTRKVGETAIQPGGEFDFCYPRIPPRSGFCFTMYGYKIKQIINGVPTVVYDGLAAHQYFSAGEPADIRVYNPNALVCADGPGDEPPSDGLLPFVMLEHVGSYGTFHFNFPPQNGVSRVRALDPDDGTYTPWYAPDCPWGGALGLRLWFSPALEPIVKYYRLKVVPVNDDGTPGGLPIVLNDSVSWDKLAEVGGDIRRVPELLGPNTVGTESNLFKVPYWSSPDHQYLSGQFHQVWNTPARSPDGRYMLLIEVFDQDGVRIQPNGAEGDFPQRAFQFRRWMSAMDTDPVPFADAAHVFWVDNTPVVGDIVDLRKNGEANRGECQFMTDTASATFGIGLRAFHVNGVEHAGDGDDNSFMASYGISWQRGLNGPTGTLGHAPAPAGGTDHTDVGETTASVSSGTRTFEEMLTRTNSDGTTTVLQKCTFSVTLSVHPKHFNGVGPISAYGYRETASFALEIRR